MKTLFALLALLLGGCATVVPDSPATRRVLATQVVDLLQLDKRLQQSRDQLRDTLARTLAADVNATPEMRQRIERRQAAIATIMEKYVTPEKMREATIDAYAATFTAAELSDLQKFYASPTGRMLVEKEPQVSRRVADSTRDLHRAMGAEMQAQTLAELSDLRPPAAPALTTPLPDESVSDAAKKIAEETYPDVQKRFEHGRQLAAEQKKAEALAEYLWCFDEGMRRSGPVDSLRYEVLRAILMLGRSYPPAMQALRDRRDAAGVRLHGRPDEPAAQFDFVRLNRDLGEEERNLAMFDQIPAGSPARTSFGRLIFDELVNSQRYRDAVASQSLVQYKRTFTTTVETMQGRPGSSPRMLSFMIARNGAKELEALAGAGHLDEAMDLLKTFLAVDSSAETRQILQSHLERAGHRELMDRPQ